MPEKKRLCEDGVERTVSEIANITGLTVAAIRARLYKGSPLLSKKFYLGRNGKKYLCEDGVERTAREIANITGLNQDTIYSRISRNAPLLSKPYRRDEIDDSVPEEDFNNANLPLFSTDIKNCKNIRTPKGGLKYLCYMVIKLACIDADPKRKWCHCSDADRRSARYFLNRVKNTIFYDFLTMEEPTYNTEEATFCIIREHI